MTKTQPNQRAQQILKAVIERYIREGQPVASKSLVEEDTIKLSPATVRNIMSELVDAGYLQSPHASAGKIPTAQGYRFFVDSLLTVQPLTQEQIVALKEQLTVGANQHTLVETTSSILSSLTRLTGIVTVPRREHLILRHVEFLSLTGNRVLVILVVNEKEVQNRIINTGRAYTTSELQQATNYLNTYFAGQDLSDIRQKLMAQMRNKRSDIARTMKTILEVVDQTFTDEQKEDYVVAGEANLLQMADEAGLDRMRSLFEAFNQKRDLLHLLDQSLNAQGVQIFIGEESQCDVLDECSVITAPYKANNEIVGVLGVIGPTRMAYHQIIAMVDITARLLTAALRE